MEIYFNQERVFFHQKIIWCDGVIKLKAVSNGCLYSLDIFTYNLALYMWIAPNYINKITSVVVSFRRRQTSRPRGDSEP